MFDAQDRDLALLNKIGKRLHAREEVIAVAESVTAGHLQAAISFSENASLFFAGGITTYNIEQKVTHLQVDSKEAEACNAVSASIALQMAKGVTHLFNSDWGIGITGYATPVPESGNALFAFYSLVYKGKEIATRKITVENTSPLQTRQFYIQQILSHLSEELER